MGMVAFACNRRCNGLQLENAVTFYACGVTETVNAYLNYIGLSSCRQTARNALETVGSKAAAKIRLVFSKKTKLAPTICLDNIDMQERVHNVRMDTRTKMYHGSWAYVHQLDDALLADVDPKAFKLDSFSSHLQPDPEKPFDPSDFFPNKTAQELWVLTVRAQIAKVAIRHVKYPRLAKKSRLFKLPPLDQIKCERPDIYMMKMMDSPDNGSEGVGRLLQELIHQTGLTPTEFARRLQIFEGDLGTCLNFRGLFNQRNPTHVLDESLLNLLLIPGAGHTLWNIAHALLLHHWGDPSDINNFGAWQTVVALGGRKEKPVAKKDFTTMLGWIEKIHEATITHVLL